MDERPQGITWPFLVVLGGLFLFAVTAPRGWEPIARVGPLLVASAAPKNPSKLTKEVRQHQHRPLASNDRRRRRPDRDHPPNALDSGPAIDSGKPDQVALELVPVLRPPRPPLRVRPAQERAIADSPSAPPAAELSTRPAVTQVAPEPQLLPFAIAASDTLNQLAFDCETSDWACKVQGLLGQLGRLRVSQAVLAANCLDELQSTLDSAESLENEIRPSAAVNLRRARHALQRRLPAWRLVAIGLTQPSDLPGQHAPAASELVPAIAAMRVAIQSSTDEAAWANFLLLDELSAAAPSGDNGGVKKVAEKALKRVSDSRLTVEQRAFMARSAGCDLVESLRRVAAPNLNPHDLALAVERFEAGVAPADAARLARQATALAWKTSNNLKSDGEWFDTYYRNANLRLTVSEDLLNQIVPPVPDAYGPVRDTVLGVPTRGQSHTTTRLAVQLRPDPHRLAMSLQASGEVAARTTSSSGPAEIHSRSTSTYTASAGLEITSQGFEVKPPSVQASSQSELEDIRTDLDVIPLVGPLVERIVLAKYLEQRSAAMAETEQKVSSQVESRFADTLGERLSLAQRRFRKEVLVPLENLSLRPEVIASSTREDRLVLRVRLADSGQLAAHTPRPRAPAGNLASVQVHQSLVNNLAEQLHLHGRTFTLAELHQWIAACLNRPLAPLPESFRKDVQIRFSARNPVRVKFALDRAEVTLAFAELVNKPRRWKNFTVTVWYRPSLETGVPLLVRDGGIAFRGQSLAGRPQIVLRGIFAKIFDPDEPIDLTAGKLQSDRRFAGLAVSQLEVIDGWLALALGPRTQADRIVRRPPITPQSPPPSTAAESSDEQMSSPMTSQNSSGDADGPAIEQSDHPAEAESLPLSAGNDVEGLIEVAP